MTQFLRAEISNAKCPLRCPDANCKAVISSHNLIKLLSVEELDKYYNYTFEQAIAS